ncbi:MAG: tryptophan synthase subunit alpha [Candidatus Dormibacteria bacterium]
MAEPAGAERLGAIFRAAREQRRAALIGYLVGGDPNLSTSRQVIASVGSAGLDLLELGIPYGDPLADGPTIAAAGQRALAAGTTLESCLQLVEQLQGKPPVIFFTYFNPVYQYGLGRFARRAARAGALGVIIPDITLEETAEVSAALAGEGLALTLLIAPTTAPERARRIAAASQGFVYLVSRVGVTGERSRPDLEPLRQRLDDLRRDSQKPLGVGFGISAPQQVAELAAIADGVIVGSGLVRSYAGRSGMDAAQAAAAYVSSLAAALAGPGSPPGDPLSPLSREAPR